MVSYFDDLNDPISRGLQFNFTKLMIVSGELGVYEPRLAAVFSSGSSRDKTNSGVLTKQNRPNTSPHTIMGKRATF